MLNALLFPFGFRIRPVLAVCQLAYVLDASKVQYLVDSLALRFGGTLLVYLFGKVSDRVLGFSVAKWVVQFR